MEPAKCCGVELNEARHSGTLYGKFSRMALFMRLRYEVDECEIFPPRMVHSTSLRQLNLHFSVMDITGGCLNGWTIKGME